MAIPIMQNHDPQLPLLGRVYSEGESLFVELNDGDEMTLDDLWNCFYPIIVAEEVIEKDGVRLIKKARIIGMSKCT